jgi:hypothetical protein
MVRPKPENGSREEIRRETERIFEKQEFSS